MAVAVKNTPESQTRTAGGGLALASLMGAVYVLGGLALVFQGVPWLWNTGVAPWIGPNLSFVNTAGLVIVMLFAAAAIWVFGLTLVGPNPPTGLRGGVFAVVVGIAIIALLTSWFGGLMERWVFPPDSTAGLAVTAAFGVGLLVLGWWFFHKYATPKRLAGFEEQGWFSTARYKALQGLRVRRATMLGLLVLLGSGVYVLMNYSTLATGIASWGLRIPFTARRITLLPDVQMTLPLLLGAAAFWFSYRIVNLPTFADFLIATEAEVNKVSWPTRRSVVQDTIVVLSTVVMMTVFLFVVDFAWGWILSRPAVGILRALDEPSKTDAAQKARGDRPQDPDGW